MLSLHGSIEITCDPRDDRRFPTKASMKLRALMKRYAELLAEVIGKAQRPIKDS